MKEYVMLFHGTHKDNIPSFKKQGLKANDGISYGARGKAFLSPRPDVAFAYAVMGGESTYNKKKKDNPDADRALIVFKVPKDWYEKHKVSENDGLAPEVGFDISIPARFIKTTVIGDRKKVYRFMPENKKVKSYKSFIEEEMAAVNTGSVGVAASDVNNIGPKKRKYQVLTRNYIEINGKRKKVMKEGTGNFAHQNDKV